MSPASCIITGQRGCFRLSTPSPRPAFSRTQVDELADYWHSDRLLESPLQPGLAHPLYPGMILDDAAFEEEAPEFPVSPELPDGQAGSYTVECRWKGDMRGTRPTKIISNGTKLTLETGWDEKTRRVISWHAEAKSLTGDASTDTFLCPAHGFSDGAKVYLDEITGGAGLVAVSLSALGTLYYIINATAESFQLSLTAGGGAVNFTTNLTAGKIRAAEFARGAAHPEHPFMYLVDVGLSDDNTAWKTADLTYRGIESSKPYKRTVNGAVTSSTSKFVGYVSLTSDILTGYPPTDSGSDAALSQTDVVVEFDAATLSLTDTYVTNVEPPTEYIGQFWAPPSPPDVFVISMSGTGAPLKYYWPYGWKVDSMPFEKMPGRDLWIVSINYRYQVPSIPIEPVV